MNFWPFIVGYIVGFPLLRPSLVNTFTQSEPLIIVGGCKFNGIDGALEMLFIRLIIMVDSNAVNQFLGGR
jgi:hypothetical protein